MHAPAIKNSLYRFNDVLIDRENFRVVKNGEVVSLSPRAYDVLLYLVEQRGRVIEKREFFSVLWKDTFVSDNALTKVIKTIRAALGDDADAPRYVETVPKRGYRFIAVLREEPGPVDAILTGRKVMSVSIQTEPGDRQCAGTTSFDDLAANLTTTESTASETKLFAGKSLPEPYSLQLLNARAESHSAPIKALHSQRQRGAPKFITFPLAVLVTMLIGFPVIAAVLYRFDRRPRAFSPVQSLAVLPFENAGGDNDTAYLAEGMTSNLIESLSGQPQLVLKARSVVFRYRGKQMDPQAVGKELGVHAVLIGKIATHSSQLDVNLELVETATGNRLWGANYTRNLDDLIILQSDIARDVLQALKLKSQNDPLSQSKTFPNDSEAYQRYLRGRYYWNKRTTKDVQRSIQYLNEAISLDPNYALAYAGLADSYAIQSGYGGSPPTLLMPKAREAALKAKRRGVLRRAVCGSVRA